jgi:CheY-like chemotaxis protein/Tfp pilus assembly protein PilZ
LNKKILILDDESDIIDLISEILVEHKYYTISSNTVNDALNIIDQNNDIDIVFADIKMPEIGGIEFLKRVKAIDPFKPKIILTTGYSGISLADIYDLGACRYIKKPFMSEDIIQAVQDITNYKYNNIEDFDYKISLSFKSLEKAICSGSISFGQGGMFIKTKQMGCVGDILFIEISYKKDDIIKFNGIGKIVWQRQEKQGNFPNGIGVEFLSLDKPTFSFVEDYTRKKQVIAYVPKS